VIITLTWKEGDKFRGEVTGETAKETEELSGRHIGE